MPENWHTSFKVLLFSPQSAPASCAASWTIIVCGLQFARLIKLSNVQFCISLFFEDFMKAGVPPRVCVNSSEAPASGESASEYVALRPASIGDDGAVTKFADA